MLALSEEISDAGDNSTWKDGQPPDFNDLDLTAAVQPLP
jgi:hypothetical protein